MISGSPESRSAYKNEKAISSMSNLYLDVGKERQGKIFGELKKKSGLSWSKLAEFLGCSQSIIKLYQRGKHRMSCACLTKLCKLTETSVTDFSPNFVEINNQPKWPKLDLSSVDETSFQTLEPKEWQKIVAVGLLTDGYMYRRKSDNRYLVSFYSVDKNLHVFFQKLILVAFNERVTTFLKTKNSKLWVSYYCKSANNPMIKTLLSFSNTYCTNKKMSPSLDFLLNERAEVKLQALRFAMSCDGSISVKKRQTGGIAYELKLACSHPVLNLQWKKLFHSIRLDLNICKDKNVSSGIQGLSTSKKRNLVRFAEIGGFLPTDVKVTNGNYVGLQKNQVLQKILNLPGC